MRRWINRRTLVTPGSDPSGPATAVGETKAASSRRCACGSTVALLSHLGLTHPVRPWLLEAAEERREAEGRHLPHGLGHDRAAHLRTAHLAVDEVDRHLDDA